MLNLELFKFALNKL